MHVLWAILEGEISQRGGCGGYSSHVLPTKGSSFIVGVRNPAFMAGTIGFAVISPGRICYTCQHRHEPRDSTSLPSGDAIGLAGAREVTNSICCSICQPCVDSCIKQRNAGAHGARFAEFVCIGLHLGQVCYCLDANQAIFDRYPVIEHGDAGRPKIDIFHDVSGAQLVPAIAHDNACCGTTTAETPGCGHCFKPIHSFAIRRSYSCLSGLLFHIIIDRDDPCILIR